MHDDQQANIRQIEKNAFMSHTGVRIESVERDRAVTYLDIVYQCTNTYGVMHGGALYTLADCCAGLVARSDGRDYVTQGSAVQFIRNAASGRVTAEGTVLSRGHTVCLVDVKVRDEDKTVLFSGLFTMFCVRETGSFLSGNE